MQKHVLSHICILQILRFSETNYRVGNLLLIEAYEHHLAKVPKNNLGSF